MRPWIALLTDFGTRDIFVGVMKGVMLEINPEASLIDITHDIESQNIKMTAIALLNSYHFFPKGTIFLVVVDPGVGSERQAIAVTAGGYTFVAPDNGVLSYVLDEIDDKQVIALNNSKYQLDQVTNTFHGRDLFAPAAAYLSLGQVSLLDMGKEIQRIEMLPKPQLDIQGNTIAGEVISIDHFGNIMTSIGTLKWLDEKWLQLQPRFGEASQPMFILAESAEIVLPAKWKMTGIRRSYHEVGYHNEVMLVDSNGFLEVAVNQGNAGQRLNVVEGDSVTLNFCQ